MSLSRSGGRKASGKSSGWGVGAAAGCLPGNEREGTPDVEGRTDFRKGPSTKTRQERESTNYTSIIRCPHGESLHGRATWPPSNSSTHLLAPSDNSRLLDNSIRGSGCKIVRPRYMCILCRHHDIKVGQAVITDDRNRGRSCHASGPWQGKRQRARTGDWCHLLGPGCLGVGQVCSFLLSSKSSVL